MCQEAGARVARNVRLAYMKRDVPVSDGRRVEVIANGLALWHGSQQGVESTIISPVTRAGETQPRADVQPGKALDAAARRKRRQTYPCARPALPLRGLWCRGRWPLWQRSRHMAPPVSTALFLHRVACSAGGGAGCALVWVAGNCRAACLCCELPRWVCARTIPVPLPLKNGGPRGPLNTVQFNSGGCPGTPHFTKFKAWARQRAPHFTVIAVYRS